MSKHTPRLLVTGGRGRLARLIADKFTREGQGTVRLFSRRGGDGCEALDRVFASETLAKGDLLLHLAWSSLPATAEAQPDLSEREDLPLLRLLLAALQAVPADRRPHFVFFSSGGAVYGDAPGRPSVEADACRPVGSYGRAKRAAEEVIEAWSRENGAACTILRISNPYGFPVPAERPQGLIPHAIRAALTGAPLTLWGDGTAQKDFIHCADFFAALERFIALRPAGVFNLCHGESHCLNEVLTEVERQTGRRIARLHSPAVRWDVQDSRLANDRLRAAIGWTPRIGLAEGIKLSLEQGA